MTGPRSSPPELAGFRYQRFLGGGGFADVFLYDQLRPARPVAIKVLRTPVRTGEEHRNFDDEANLMARVSAHPSIVTIYGADVTSDGRAYLVMEYYPGPHFGLRAREENLSVAEVLRTGILVAGAVETAHRAGILHRDIKPANILTSGYRVPGLTDFGISTAREGGTSKAGVSVPFTPREILDETSAGDVASDVYSLTATLYTLLAGRSPFEIAGCSNATADMLERILHDDAPPVGRKDMPPSLEHLLAQGLSKQSAERPHSVAALIGALQSIQRELQLPVTEPEVQSEETRGLPGKPSPTPADDDDRTRHGKPQVIRQPEGAPQTHPAILWPPVPGPTSDPPRSPPVVPAGPTTPPGEAAGPSMPDDTAKRTPPVLPLPQTDSTVRRSRMFTWAAAAVLGIVGLTLVYVLALRPGPPLPVDPSPSPSGTGGLVITPMAPDHVTVVPGAAGVTVTWTASDHQPGDSYGVARVDGSHRGEPAVSTDKNPPFFLPISGSTSGVCVEVFAKRGARQSVSSTAPCTP